MDREEYLKLLDGYLDRLWEGSMDDSLRLAVSRAVKFYRRNRDEALKLFPKVPEMAERLREVKEWSLTHRDELIKELRDRVEDSKGFFFYAETVEDALEYVGDVVGEGATVTKAKSLTCEELHINEFLEERGCKVYETDLGEFIIQHLGEKPMHILSPAIHVPRERVAELFSKIYGKPLPPDIPTLVAETRKYLRDVFMKADVGITGANAVAADTGTVFIIENEGNARLVAGLPEKHIAIAGVEKVLPTLMDCMMLVEVAARYANYKAPTYVNMICGPSKSGDIEKCTVYGVHGPREFHLVILDNHRTDMIRDDVYRQALYCLRCGGCMYECPVYGVVAGYFGHIYVCGIGAALTRFLLGGLERAAPIAYTCTMCGRCVEHCPMSIDIPEIIMKIRKEAAEAGLTPPAVLEGLRKFTGVNFGG